MPSAPPTADPPSSSPFQLRLLTLNVWGLRFISSLRTERLHHLCTYLLSSHVPTYDIICLQELWYESVDWRHLRSRLSVRYPHSHYFLSGAFGSGLAVLSRWPVIEARTHAYSLNGLPIHVHHGDWFVGKACGSVTLDVEGLGEVDVWNTHLVATGDESDAHRIVQAYELATNARASAMKGRHTIVCGDLNCRPDSLGIRVVREVGGLRDAFQHRAEPVATAGGGGVPATHAHRALVQHGVTCDSPLNTWTKGKKPDARTRRDAGKRLDYIWFREPERPRQGEGRLECRECNVVLTDPCPGLQVSVSDHFGVEALFDILEDSPSSSSSCSHGASAAETEGKIRETLGVALKALSRGFARSRETQRNHVAMFAAAVTLALGMVAVNAVVQQGGVRAVATLVAVAAGWAGTTMLYSAVVWAEWEKRTLRTVMQTMEMEMKRASTNRGDADAPVEGLGEREGDGEGEQSTSVSVQEAMLI
ncbi:phospholipase C type enzyme [Thecaphora frezii]